MSAVAAAPSPSPGLPLVEQVQALRRLALVATRPAGPEIYEQLVDEVARALGAALAMVTVFTDERRTTMRTLAAVVHGQPIPPLEYRIANSPCAEVVGQGYRFMRSGVLARYGTHAQMAHLVLDTYAAFPMYDSRGEPLGLVAALDPQEIAGGDADHAEAVLKIAAVRLAAELERSAADEALRRSAASYREIFQAAEDAILVHDWETFRLVDVNDKAVQSFGYTRDELLAIDPAQLMSGEPPYDMAHALAHLERARHGRCPPFEWQSRLKGGQLQWQEVILKPVTIDGRAKILAFARDITERKAAEEKLRASEEQYRAIFNASADALILWNSRYQRVDVNAAYERIYGWSRDEVIGRGFEHLPYPEEHARPRRELVRRALAGEPCRAELQAIRKDGTCLTTEVHAIPFTHLGEPHVLAIARDITERKAAEAQLRASEAQYRAIFDASADALMLWNSRLQRVDVNVAHERIFGFAREDVVGHGFENLNYPEEFVRPRLEMVQRALTGEPCRAELEAIRKDGSRILTELRSIPFQHRGEPHVLQIARDITERKKAEADLRAREELHRVIFDSSVDAMVLYDRSLHLVDINLAFERIRGFSRKELVGRHWSQRADAEDFQDVLALIESALAGREASIIKNVPHADGKRIDMELRYLPVRLDGEPYALGIGRDVTQRRAAEAERLQLEAQLRQAQKMEAIGQLTGGIAHDFNNILTSVIGYIVLAQERAERGGDATLVRQLGAAQTAAQRARDLIAQMLAFARRQRGDRRVIDLTPVLRQSLQLLRPTMPASITLDDAGLGTSLELPPVRADAVQIEQVLFNLCINARDAVHRSGRIAVRLRECKSSSLRCTSCGKPVVAGRWVELEVADTGCGIEPAVLPRMFEPFFTTKEVGRGSGMGLAMVHGIVHDHDGHVVVDSVPGHGTAFRVLLPATDGAVEAARPCDATPGTERPLRGRVMLVEDEPMVAGFMRELLEGWGLEVVVPADARAAARWFDDPAHDVDLLLTDLTMPQMTGLELAHHVGVLRPDMPVLLYSGDADALDDDALRRAGVRARVDKPVDPRRLKLLLRRWLGTR